MNAASVLEWLKQNVAPSAQLCLDSRQIQAGDVFFATPGMAGDGRDFIDAALQHGAAAVVLEQPDTPFHIDVPHLAVPNLTALLGEIAHEWWGKPSEEVKVIAVTGTNGKTSCVQWIAAMLNNSQVPCGTVGTLGVTMPDGKNLGGELTTPDVLTMHKSLALLRDAGANLVALEASSIGIDQGRLDGVRIEIAAFTNLSHDHLDYHHTADNYRDAKAKLFSWKGLRSAVLNADDAFGQALLGSDLEANKVSYSMQDSSALLYVDDLHTGADGQVFNIVTAHGTAQILTRLLGDHNVSNLLLVAGVLRELGWPIAKISRLIATLGPVPGRLEIVDAVSAVGTHTATPLAVVDYAHTPDALERALEALRTVAEVRGGKLICVFGCGGDRDRVKRPLMGEVAARLADEVIVTNDNPRSEDPDQIIQEICQGLEGVAHTVQQDRAKAILQAIWFAEPADLILIAGKGHETYQEIKGERFAFDDREWARFALSWLRGPTLATDTRQLQPNDLFVAIKGYRFDGHEYLLQAAEKGACAAIVETPNKLLRLPQFTLGDTRSALAKMAQVWRQKFDIPVVAVCGSNGKTTTKEMIASIFRAHFGPGNTVATIGNFNNELGVPLSVLRLRSHHEAAVFELGMNHPGEIAVLAAIVAPTIALVNNAQREHQEFMHTVEAVAKENGAVLQALAENGTAVFPGDDTFTALWQDLAANRAQLQFGFGGDLDVRAEHIHANPTDTPFYLYVKDQDAAVILKCPGVHNLRNALAASACSFAAGVGLTEIVTGLQEFRPVAGRMQAKVQVDGYQLIDDSYNANPDSVLAAIDVLAQLQGPTVLVLGDMAEVGANSQQVHAEVGNYAREQGVRHVLALGAEASYAAQAYGPSAQSFDNIDLLIARVIELAPAHILVKGSRSARMERVVQALEQYYNHKEGADNAS